jgi:hypothetical protein
MWRLYQRAVDPDGEIRSQWRGLIIRRQRTGDRTRLSLFGPLAVRTSNLDETDWSWFNFSGRADAQ